ncbi:ABC transporter ATP-binding protein [Rubrivirga sp.]|uniref:ABC transporter ATP-binding protein n=1 Tax=Rubrivirga sp. TaxID=1885344 RepID=UPI003B52A687
MAELRGRLAFVRFALRLVWDAAPRYSAVWAALLLVQGLVPPIVISLTKRVVDAANAAVGAGLSAETLVPVLVPVGAMAALYALQQVASSVTEWVTVAQGELVEDHVKSLIHERSVASDYGFYESPDYHDLLEQVNAQAGSRTLQLLQGLGAFAQSSVTLVSLAALLMSYSVLIPVALVASTVPAFLIVVRHNRRYHAWWKGATPRRRRVRYYDSVLTSDATAAEVRIYGLGDWLRATYRSLRAVLFRERVVLVRRQSLAKLGAVASASVVTLAVLAWVGLRAVRGEATLGDIALFYQAFSKGQSVVNALLQSVGQVYTHTLFLEHLHAFLGQTDELRDPPDPVPVPAPFRRGIAFEGVTFRYPGAQAPALRAFDLEVPAGKVVAMVGENGAGKSTFIKLLCRFYDPDQGRVTIDGIDLRSFAQDDLRRQISVMFQSPTRYHMTVEQNIRLGDLDSDAGAEAVREAARGSGADALFEGLPKGYKTPLGRWFQGGVELSGGEWQRVALARSFFRQASLVVLDEPTSAMDSWTEHEWLTRFREMVAGQTALLITHRFTTAMRADVIHVVEHGAVVESGSHAELLELGGRYATSWRDQMEQARSASALEGGGDGATRASVPG